MCLHQSADLNWNLYRTCDPWHMHQDWNIERWEEEYVYIHMRVAHLQFLNFVLHHCHWVTQVAFWADVASVLVEVHILLCATSMPVDSVLCNFGKECSRPDDFYEPLLGVFLVWPSPCRARETQLLTSSFLGRPCNVSWSGIAFAQMECAKTLLWPLWPYSRQVTCRTVLVVPNLIA